MTLTVTEMRYAFERDMVRKLGDQAFKVLCGILELCVICGDDFDKKTYNQKTCSSACRKQLHVDRQRKYDRAGADKRNVKRREVRAADEPQAFADLTGADRHNLVTALIRACVQEMLYAHATKESTGVTLWLEEFAEVYMAAIGEHINIDSILEKIDDQT